MKRFVLLAILLVVYPSQEISLFYNCPENVTSDPNYANHCLHVSCKNDSSISVLGCPLSSCIPGDELYQTEDDLTKVYPACCGGPVCRDRSRS
ncbi:hypothetical protein KM043_010978 [Ampulex compressa]|uniref:Venom protein n=1 Tax=Ampulex compressa TaxID=860918 RepID=A0A1W6EW53_AMPCP|nr:venom protein [Ampulex compressa]KAG7211732.1 hypothetical protein KM043_010978 [Ampulex compressa]